MPQSAGHHPSMPVFDEEGEGAFTSFEGRLNTGAVWLAAKVRGDENPRPEVFAMSGSDTKSNGEAEGSDAEVKTEVPSPLNMEPRVRAPLRAFTSLDAVCLTDTFEKRARVMWSVPVRGERRFQIRIEDCTAGDY